MTGKLYKLQFREVGRIARILIPLTFLFVIATSASALLRIGFLTGIMMFLTILMIVGSAFVLFFLVISNDYHNMQGKRAYFVRSIPAEPKQLFTSRFLYYLSFFLLTIAALLLQVFLLVILMTAAEGSSVSDMLETIRYLLRSAGIGFILATVGYGLFALVMNSLVFMFVISVGSEAPLRHFGIGGPVLVYIIYYVVMQVVSFVGLFAIPIGVRFNAAAPTPNQANFELVAESTLPQFIRMVQDGTEPTQPVIGLGIIPLYIILAIVVGILTYRSMSKRLTLN